MHRFSHLCQDSSTIIEISSQNFERNVCQMRLSNVYNSNLSLHCKEMPRAFKERFRYYIGIFTLGLN